MDPKEIVRRGSNQIFFIYRADEEDPALAQYHGWLDCGATMYWSHTGEAGYRTMLETDGFKVLWTRIIPEGNGGHMLILAQKPATA